jgi:hypothetical protein
VARGVGQGLLHHAVDRDLQLGRQPLQGVDLRLHPGARGGLEAVGQAADRGLDAEVVQRRRAQLRDERPQVPDVLLELGHRRVDGGGQVLRAPAPRVGEPQPEPAERLQRLVVQLAGPAPALLLRGGQALAQAVLRDGPGHRDGRRRARRERVEQRGVLGPEGGRSREPVEGREDPEPHAAVDERDDERVVRALDAEGRQAAVQVPGRDAAARGGRREVPAAAATRRTSSSSSRTTTARAPTSARPRSATSARTRSSSTSLPSARTTSVVASRRRSARSASSRRPWASANSRALSTAIAAQSARTTAACSSASVNGPPARSVR